MSCDPVLLVLLQLTDSEEDSADNRLLAASKALVENLAIIDSLTFMV